MGFELQYSCSSLHRVSACMSQMHNIKLVCDALRFGAESSVQFLQGLLVQEAVSQGSCVNSRVAQQPWHGMAWHCTDLPL
jgi:hypothetical protein